MAAICCRPAVSLGNTRTALHRQTDRQKADDHTERAGMTEMEIKAGEQPDLRPAEPRLSLFSQPPFRHVQM